VIAFHWSPIRSVPVVDDEVFMGASRRLLEGVRPSVPTHGRLTTRSSKWWRSAAIGRGNEANALSYFESCPAAWHGDRIAP